MSKKSCLEQVAGILTRRSLRFDTATDGESYRIPMESSLMYVHVLGSDDEPIVRLTAPLVQNLELGERRTELLARLNELNCRGRYVKVYLIGDMVVAHYAIPGSQMQESELFGAMGVLGAVSEELDDTLKIEFGGDRGVELLERAAATWGEEEE